VRLETERLVLRLPRQEDAEDFLAVWGDEETTRFVSGLKSREDVEAMIGRMERHWDRYDVGLFTIERKADGRALGRVGLLLWDPQRWTNGLRDDLRGRVETEIGWTVARDQWGRGYATEGALACRDWALGDLGLTRLISLIAHENAASIRVAEKLGESFERELETDRFAHPVGIWSLGETMDA
jgi:RimJ/RimL family protein N-acetyltransferase